MGDEVTVARSREARADPRFPLLDGAVLKQLSASPELGSSAAPELCWTDALGPSARRKNKIYHFVPSAVKTP